MATLSLKISLEGGKVVKTIQFDPSTAVYDACRIIREKILEASAGDPKEYGLFLASEEDNKKGIWLEASRSLDYYMLRNGDLLEYNKKTRNLRVRMLDGTVKTLLVDDSQIVANLMVVICTKIGITNYDEYGLVREEQKDECDPCDKPNFGTLTLRRKHQERERDAKMDQLRKKLRTDDEVNWVEGSKTLREQGIEVGETLLLRRKLFFSDRNVDARDPVQLTLLYVQARDAMLDGTHPITQDKACEFAGIQCQIQFGDHKEDKHTTGFLDLKEFLPASYMKIKGIEKKVFKEHKRHAGLSELDAKVLYTKNARDLKTYGVAFFLVKEKMKGKNKLVPRLLGVTKDSVLRLDEKTKEILQTWPLTTVRRWCASPNTFTLDFGDYSDQYYSVQTTEAEQILQVIAGYIDIIVRKRRARDHLGIEGDEGSAMLEDSVAPSRANIIQHDTFKSERKVNTESVAKPAVVRPGAEGAKPFAVGHVTGAQQTTISGQIITGHTPPAAAVTQKTHVTSLLSAPQRALLTTISSGREVIKQTEERLQRAELPALGQDASSVKWRQVTMDTSKQVVTSQIAAMNAATAQVVTLTSGPTEEVDHTAVGAAITTITTNLPEMTKGVQMLAALMEDSASGDRLLDATRHLCNAFSDLLKAAEPETKEPRQNLLNAASRVGEASTSVLHTIGEENEQDKETQDILLSLAKAVANTTAALVLKAKNVAAHCKDDQPLQNTIIQAATSCALATSQLVACTKVVAPTLSNPACREQLSAAARAVALAVDRLVAACQPAPAAAAPAVEQLTAAAQRVSEELERLLRHCDVERRPSPVSRTTYVESVVSASERVWGAADSTAMLRHARSLGQATAHLITSIKTEAESQPSESQRRLLAAAKLLADATARMVEAARQCASSPQDREKQDALRRAAEEVREIAADYAHGQDVAATQVARLADATMRAADAATQLATAAGAAARYNGNGYTQEILESSCSQLTSAISPAVGAARRASPPAGAAAQLDLIAAAEGMLQTHGSVSAAVRGAMPSVSEPSAARRLADTAQTYNAANADLRSAVSRARISCKGVELEAAAEILRALQQELDEVEEAARAYELTPLPGQTAEWSAHTMSSSSRIARSSAAQLVTAARLRDRGAAGAAAGDLAAAMREFSQGVRGATAVQEEMQTRERVISSGRQVLHSSLTLVETVTHHLETTETIDSTSLVEIAQDISQGLEQTMAAVPSHAELERVIEEISETLNILSMGEFPPSDRTYSELQTELTMAAEELNSASGEVAERPGAAAAAQHYRSAHDQLMGVAMEMAGHQEEQESRTLMVSSMKTVTVTSTKLLTAALAAAREPARAHHRHHLPVAARAVTDAINHLVDVCTEASPGQKECAAAIRSIEAARALLAPSDSPRQDLGYYGCLDAVVAHSKGLSEGMSGMASAVKRSQPEPFAAGVRAVAAAVRGLVESAAQAAYLVAVSSPQSVAGRAGLVDQAMFARAQLAIDAACDTLADSSTTQQQVLTAATEIAKYTSALCNACRAASAHTAAAAAKRHFVQAAKDVANSTAALVKEIKALDADYSEANRTRCAAATAPLRAAVRSLCQFADGPEFAAVPARISAQGRIEQKQILDCGRNIITGSCAMLESARRLALASGGGEREHWQALASHSKSVSDAIKDLVHNIREKAPGQAECASAIELLADQQRILDQTSLQQVAQELEPRTAYTLQGYSEQVENSTAEMLERLEPLRVAAAAEAENLGHAVTQLVSYASPLVSASAGAASLARAADATAVLLRARTVLEALSSLVGAAKQAAGNPRAVSAHGAVSAGCEQSRVALTECGAAARDLAAHHGAVRPLLDAVARAKDRLTDHRMSLVGSYDEADSFVDYQTRMVAAAKEIVRLSTDMTAKAATDPSQLLTVANELVQRYEALARDAVGAAATTPNADIANRLRISCVELGEAVGECCLAGGRCRAGNAPEHQREVATASRHVGEKAVQVLGALQAGSRGTQACIDAAATIAALLGDIDTTILFASAGTLHSDVENDTFALHREAILRAARALVEHTKGLVAAAAGSQDQLADAAGQAVTTVVQLCSVVKLGAASLGGGERSAEPQVLVLNAARDAAAALRDLAAATAAAAGKALAHPDMERLKHAARVMVTNVTSLLKTVKAVEDEHTRGTRALESTIEAISQEIEVLQSPSPAKDSGSPEEVVRATRRMTAATARAVAAGNCAAQDQLTAAANLGRRTVAELLLACKNAAWSAETPELRARTIEAGRAAAAAYRALLQAVLQAAQGDSNAKHSFPELSRRVAHTVADIIAAAELLKGSDWVDPDDPTVIAETELLGAAASIDAAAKKLDALRPRKAVKVQEADESLNFDEMILEAAKSIIAATSALVRAASAAQRELIDQGKVARRPASSSDDGQWSEGLVSAARLVAAAAHALVEAANALVQGAASEERLISAARHVASSTAQLLVACKVKADPSSESTRRLQSAGAEVIRSTDNLVRAARDAISCEEERSLVLNRRMVGGIAQEIDARSEVLRIEKELEEARGRLTAIRQAKYKLRTGDTSGDETDHGQDSDASGLHGYRPTSSFANTTYSPNSTQTTHNNTTNLSHHVSQLNQSIHGPSSPGYGPGYQAQSPGYLAQSPGYTAQSPGYTAQSPGFSAQSPGYIAQSPGYTAQSPGFSAQSPGYIAQSPGYTAQSPGYQAQSPGYQAQPAYKSEQNQTNGYMQTQNVYSTRDESQKYTAQTPSFTSFRPQEENKQNYQGFTTHDSSRNDRTMVNKDNYETRLYDTPRPAVPVREDYRQESQTTQTRREHRSFDTQHTAPMSPKFNARELKFEDKDYAFSPLKKPLDGVGQTFTEHHKSTEAIPGGTRQSEFTVKSESYSSGPKVEYGRTVAREETKSPFVSSTPAKFDKSDSYNQYSQHSEFSKNVSSDLVKVPTPDYERISSPYGKEVHSYGGPNYMEETTTEVKEIPNGTQKVTTTKIYSSSPVNLTTTNTKYEPIKLEGIDELSKSFDNDSKYSTMDSRFNTLDSKMSSDTSRSFMRPSDFQSSDYQATTSVSKVKKPSELVKELDAMDKKFSKQTVTSERIEKKSVMTSSHKSETSSTVTKKFGNF